MKTFFLFFLGVDFVFGLNFVIYLDLIGKSHLNFVSSLIDLLNERGHNVDLLIAKLNTAVDIEGATNARKVVSFEFPGESPWMTAKHLTDPFEDTEPYDMSRLFRINTELCRVGLESGEPLKFLKEGNYDAILVSQYEYCGLIFAKAAGISSVVSYTATNMMPTQAISTGLPNSPNSITGNMDSDNGNFDLWSRITRFYYWNKFMWFTRAKGQDQQTALAREFFGADFPEIEELERNIDLVFINANEITEIPRTVTHKIAYIGGVAMRSPKTIDKDFDKLLSLSHKGNVLISFGTQVPAQIISRRVKEAVVYAAESLKEYTFIFKYELQDGDGDLFSNATNLHLVRWIPQTDALYSGKISVFVSHMGLNSLHEATSAGVSLVSIPLFADQSYNARCVARLGMGIILKKSTFTGIELTSALATILENESFKLNAEGVSEMLKDKPEEAKKKFVDWVEFAAKHKNVHKIFNLPETETSFFIYYCYDLLLYSFLVIFFVFLGLFISYKVLMWMFTTMKTKYVKL